MKISYKELAEKFLLPDFKPDEGFGSEVAPVFYAWKFSVAAKPEELWQFVADTSLFNRYIGLSPRTETEKDGVRWVETTVFGVRQEWVEKPWTWIAGRNLEFVRNYTTGITRSVRCNMILDPTSHGTDLYVAYYWVPQSVAMRLFLAVTDSVMHDNFAKAFTAIEKSLAKNPSSSAPASPSPMKLKNDPATNVNLLALDKLVHDLKATSKHPAALDGIADFIKQADDADLYRIRAIELAMSLGLKKRDVISACMESVRAGLLTISWDVVCPHCRGVRFEASTLGQIPPNSECLVCEIDFETDTLESIEVTFHVSSVYRKVSQVLFCSAEPAKKDHIQVQQVIPAYGTSRFQIPLKEGRHRLRLTGAGANLLFEVKEEAENKVIRWNTDVSTEKIECGPMPEFVLENQSAFPKAFTLEQLWWKDHILHPVDVFAIPDFQDVFSRESLDSQVRISLGIQTIMFTDIVNSTGFYSTRGDAAAFNAVRKHFTEAFAIVEKHEGTVIKTIGDSVMACFLSSEKALKASFELQECFAADRADTPIRLRVSLHSGQVIAVHLNQGLDLFGNSVNKAAKLQSCAGGGEIALSTEFFDTSESSWFAGLEPAIETRTSGVNYKELPLEARVISYHQAKRKGAPKSA